MSILDRNSIDIINIENDECLLIITDHLEWDKEHLIVLQYKINLYLHYIESEQIYINTPDARGKKIVIKLICKFKPDQSYIAVLDDIQNVLSGNNIDFIYEIVR